MPPSGPLRRFSRAERIRVSVADAGGGLALPLASRRTRVAGLGAALGFVVAAAILWSQIAYWRSPRIVTLVDRAVAGLKVLLLVGLGVAAVVLLLLAVGLLLYRESARLGDNRLIHVARFGPFRVHSEYDLTKVRNLRAVESGNRAQVRFDYDSGDQALGSDTTPADAAARVKMIQAAIDGLGRRASQAVPAPRPTPKP